MRKSPRRKIENVMRCPLCDKVYQQANIVMFEEQGGRATFHMTCRQCMTSAILFSAAGKFGVVSVGMMTDLDRMEASRILARDAVSADHVIDMHAQLRKHNGTVKELLIVTANSNDGKKTHDKD